MTPAILHKHRSTLFAIILVTFAVLATFNSLQFQPVYASGIICVQGHTGCTTTTSSHGTATSGTTVSITMAAPPTNGNVIVVAACSVGSSVSTVNSITENGVIWSGGGTGPQIGSALPEYVDGEIWFGIVGASASTTVTITFSSTLIIGIVNAFEYSNVATSSFLDKTASNSGTVGNGVHPDTGTTVTTTQSNELFSGVTCDQGDGAQTTPTNGFSLVDGVVVAGTESNAYLEKLVSSTQTANSQTSVPQTGGSYVGVVATFKAATSTSTTLTSILSSSGTSSTSMTSTSLTSATTSTISATSTSVVTSSVTSTAMATVTSTITVHIVTTTVTSYVSTTTQTVTVTITTTTTSTTTTYTTVTT